MTDCHLPTQPTAAHQPDVEKVDMLVRSRRYDSGCQSRSPSFYSGTHSHSLKKSPRRKRSSRASAMSQRTFCSLMAEEERHSAIDRPSHLLQFGQVMQRRSGKVRMNTRLWTSARKSHGCWSCVAMTLLLQRAESSPFQGGQGLSKGHSDIFFIPSACQGDGGGYPEGIGWKDCLSSGKRLPLLRQDEDKEAFDTSSQHSGEVVL